MAGLARKIVWLALLLLGGAHAEVPVPALSARVTDLTATLAAPQIQALEARLADFQARKGAQLAVLMLPSTQPETVEQFSLRVVEQWKLGRKGTDDGVLLLIAKEDRAVRIEVGYGLEGALNDATAKRIIAEVLTPFFQRGEFYAGVDATLSALMSVVAQEPLPDAKAAAAGAAKYSAPSPLSVALGVLLVFVVIGVWYKRSPATLSRVAALLRDLFMLLLVMSSRGGGSGRGGFGGGGFRGGGGGFGGGGASGKW